MLLFLLRTCVYCVMGATPMTCIEVAHVTINNEENPSVSIKSLKTHPCAPKHICKDDTVSRQIKGCEKTSFVVLVLKVLCIPHCNSRNWYCRCSVYLYKSKVKLFTLHCTVQPRNYQFSGIFPFIVYSAPSCASQPIRLHRNLHFWPT